MLRRLTLALDSAAPLAGDPPPPAETPAHQPPPEPLSVDSHRGVLREATAWARGDAQSKVSRPGHLNDETFPLFECSDADITTAYYYRWRLFWMHLKHDPKYGYTLSEFLPRVNWAGPFGTINCPFGHQAAEGRWLRRPDIMDNYSLFWFRHPHADRRYTWWPASAAHARFLLDGRLSAVTTLLPHLKRE